VKHLLFEELSTAWVHRQAPIDLALQVERHLMCNLRRISRDSDNCDGPDLSVDAQELLATCYICCRIVREKEELRALD